LQIFKAGKLVFTTAASKSFNQGKDDLPFCFPFEKSITFPVETVVQSDILIRCRHLTRKGQRVSMFRAAMHTGYIPPKVLRLRKSEIDGACSDKRYADDFFIDLVFEECSASMASKHLLSTPENEDEDEDETEMKFSKDAKGDVHSEASLRRMGGTIVGSETSGAITVTASAYDSMLHRDSRFWDVIAQRRNEKNQAGTSAPASDPSGEANVCSPFYGPTIGRRREFLDEAASSSKSKDDEDSGKLSVSSKKSALQSFTIGGELDFTLADEASSGSSAHETSVLTTTEDLSIQKKDDLMDALMAIDDELDEEEVDDEEIERIDQDNSIVEVPNSVMTEEIVFGSTSVASLESSNEDVIIAPLKADEASFVEVAEDEAKEILPATVEENSMNLDDLVINGTVSANIDNEGDDGGYDFSDDDDELADIEQFLMKS
jgi:tensin